MLLGAGEKGQCPQSRPGQSGLSNTHIHMHTCPHVHLLPIPAHHCLPKRWLTGCACTHTHPSFLLILLDTPHKHTHHTPSNIHYTDNLLTKTRKPQVLAHLRHSIYKHTLSHPLHAWYLSYLDHNHLDGNMVWQSDWGPEILGQSNQQVQDGYQALGMNS